MTAPIDSIPLEIAAPLAAVCVVIYLLQTRVDRIAARRARRRS